MGENNNNENIITFRTTTLPREVIHHLNKLAKINKKGEFINDAINQYYLYIKNPRFFIKTIIELNFGLVRHLLRKIGRKN